MLKHMEEILFHGKISSQWMYGIRSVRYKKESKKSFKSYIYILVTMIVASFLIVFIKQFRETGNLSDINMGSVFTDVLGELGSSFFPLTLIMRVCPSRHPFLHGSSYLYSILGGFIPESLDITGTVSRWNARATVCNRLNPL